MVLKRKAMYFHTYIFLYMVFLLYSGYTSSLESTDTVTFFHIPILYYVNLATTVILAPIIEEFIFRLWLIQGPSRLKITSLILFTVTVINQFTKLLYFGGGLFEFIYQPIVLYLEQSCSLSSLFGSTRTLGVMVNLANYSLYFFLALLIAIVVNYTNPKQLNTSSTKITYIVSSLSLFVLWHHNTWNIINDPILLYISFGGWYTYLAFKKGILVAILAHAFFNMSILASRSLPAMWLVKDYTNFTITLSILLIVCILFSRYFSKQNVTF